MQTFSLRKSAMACMREMSSTKSSPSLGRLACIAGHFRQPQASLCSGSTSIPETAFAKDSTLPPVTPGKLRLYSMRFCPWAQRTRLVLLHKNIPHETVNVNLAHKPAWLWEKNPLGLVPILELDGKIVYESSATCMWLDDMYPENKLTPSDPFRKAWDRTLEDYFLQLAGFFYGILRKEDIGKVTYKLNKCYTYYENVLVERGGPFFGGDKPAMIDFLMWPHMERIPAIFSHFGPDGLVDKVKYPNLDAWFQHMYTLPAVKDTMFDDDSHRVFMLSLVNKTLDAYDYGL